LLVEHASEAHENKRPDIPPPTSMREVVSSLLVERRNRRDDAPT
jgi:hypothetical protein